jgi:predicted ATPase/DNA-binding winged helix-turn-helix (wHTH) protein
MLLEDGRHVRVGSRAKDILFALLARAGQVVPKRELIAAAWPETYVEEANLRVHIGALRKALRDLGAKARFIENVPGRGYCFVGKVTNRLEAHPATSPQDDVAQGMPAVAHAIGRAQLVAELCGRLTQHRLITLVGPGGIGKTTVGIAVANAAKASYSDGLVFVDLAPVNDAAVLVGVVAAALGLPGRADPSFHDLEEFLRDRRLLVVLDSCEHLIDASAALAERLIQTLPRVSILVTSREPLRAKGEWVERLPPLGLPPLSDSPTAAEIMTFPAVQLFVDRAAACLGGYELSDTDAPVVADICRRLDGIALAIELAAGRLDTLGLLGLASSLQKSFLTLTRGRRTALPRHQTMRAALDWSFQFLSDDEQSLLRRLAVFNGSFSSTAARAVAGDSHTSEAAIYDLLANLVEKSLVTVNLRGRDVSYRLFETTRSYGFEQLAACDEVQESSRRHACYYRELFERAEAEWEVRAAGEWLAEYAQHVDNLRVALDWAFSEQGDAATAIALTATSVPLWFQLSLVDECLRRVARALSLLDGSPEPDLRRRMQLYGALGWPQLRAISGSLTGSAAWKEALRLAELIDDKDYQQRALWALWVDRTNNGQPREALAIAEKFSALAASMNASAEERIGERMRARSLLFLGALADAQDCVDQMLDRYAPPVKKSHLARFQYDQKLLARITLARVLWLRGCADQARREIVSIVDEAVLLNHTLTLAHVLSDAACPVALMIGDLELASQYTAMLHEKTKIHALDVWKSYADGFSGEIALRRGDAKAGIDALRRAIETLAQSGFILYQTSFTASLALGLIASGRIPEGLRAVGRAIAQCEQTGEAWLLAELHRIQGEAQLRGRQTSEPESGEVSLLRSLEIARDQGAKAWELRAATTLATHWSQKGRSIEAKALISQVLSKISEGFSTPDYVAARAVMAD